MKTFFERLSEPPSPVDVADNNIYVRATVDTVDSVNSFMLFGIPQLGVKGSLGHQGPMLLGAAQWEDWQLHGILKVPRPVVVLPVEDLEVDNTVGVVVVEQHQPGTNQIDIQLLQILDLWYSHRANQVPVKGEDKHNVHRPSLGAQVGFRDAGDKADHETELRLEVNPDPLRLQEAAWVGDEGKL